MTWLASSLLLFAMTLSLGLVAPAGAAQPQAVTIVQHSSRGCISGCTFSMVGALTDLGTVTVDDEHVAAISSPVVGTDHVIRTMHGQLGDLTLRVETLLQPTDDPALFQETGRWIVASGTGAFAAVRGRGNEKGTRNFAARTIDIAYSGQVQSS